MPPGPALPIRACCKGGGDEPGRVGRASFAAPALLARAAPLRATPQACACAPHRKTMAGDKLLSSSKGKTLKPGSAER